MKEKELLKERLSITEGRIVWRFGEDEVPQFVQGQPGRHEMTAPVTAEQCEYMVKEIARLQAKSAGLEALAREWQVALQVLASASNGNPLLMERFERETREVAAQALAKNPKDMADNLILLKVALELIKASYPEIATMVDPALKKVFKI